MNTMGVRAGVEPQDPSTAQTEPPGTASAGARPVMDVEVVGCDGVADGTVGDQPEKPSKA